MKKKYIVILGILLLFLGSILIYLNTYYKASSDVNDYLESNDIVIVKKDRNGYLFDGPGEDNILVFYPGAKVEYTSYAPLLSKIALEGVDTYIVSMPFNISFFKMNAIKDVMKDYKYDNWFIGGHSMGGAVAAMAVKKNNVKGLILLAAYATDKIDCKVLSIYGSNDGVLNLKKYEDNKKNILDSIEIIIDGGNHAYFGNYGEQKGDNEATISREEQQDRTVTEIVKMIKDYK